MLAVTCPRCSKPRDVNELFWISPTPNNSDSLVSKLVGFECGSCEYIGVFDERELPDHD